MDRLALTVFVLLMCVICECNVKLRPFFLLDTKSDAIAKVIPAIIWEHLKRSELLRGHLSDTPLVKNTVECNLQGATNIIKGFQTQAVNTVHGFIGPVCSYYCEVTGLVSSTYSIPQVCSFRI